MSVKADKMPAARTLLAAIDTTARQTVQKAGREVAPIVARETPHKSGQTAIALRPRVRRTPTGAALVVAPARGRRHANSKATIAQVVRWVQSGTGVKRVGGGAKARIRSNRRPPRRLILPGGKKVWTVAGQDPNPFMGRIQAAGTLRVARVYRDGAADAARAVERVIG